MNLGPAKRSTKRLLLDELPLAGRNISTRRLAQLPIKEKDALRIYPDSFAFPLLLGLMASLPTFRIEAPLPSLSTTGDDLGTTSAELGLASVYLMSLGVPALAYGTISDRVGRDGEAGGAKMANVILAIYIVPMIAPTVGAALLALSSWRAIYLVPIAGGLMLLMAMSGISESAKIDPYARLGPTPIARNYLRIQRHPVSAWPTSFAMQRLLDPCLLISPAHPCSSSMLCVSSRMNMV